VKRRIPDLSHVLDDSRPLPALPIFEKRIHTRFDKAFVVVIGSELYGDALAVARNVSTGGILVEMPYAPPLGTVVTVHFRYARETSEAIGETVEQSDVPRSEATFCGKSEAKAERKPTIDEIVARAEVKHHHYLNFGESSARAIGLRFLEFVDAGERIDPERIQ
jgi:hypothetical protein